MKRFGKALAAVLCVMLFAGCGSSSNAEAGSDAKSSSAASPSTSSETKTPAKEQEKEKTDMSETQGESQNAVVPLHVKGAQLVNEQDQPVQLRGVSTHGMAWYPQYVNPELFGNLKKNWGINVVRLAMYTAESGGYTTDGNKDELKALIDKGVKAAVENDLYVIIDWHILSDNDPNMHKDEAIAFFKEMSQKYGKLPNVLFEICNEPNGGTTWAQVKSYAEEVIPVIRANSPDNIIIVGTPTWSQDVDQALADPITDSKNLMYTLHFYAATHQADLREKMVKAYEGGLPIFVTEFGITDASGNGAIDVESADEWVKVMDEHHISYIIWNMSNKDEASAMFVTDECKNPQDKDLSEEGKWFKALLTGKPIQKTAEEKALENGLVWRISGSDKWTTDGKAYQKFNVTVTNNTGNDLDNWKVQIPFNTDIAISDQWNATFSVRGMSLVVEGSGNNGSLAAGASTKDAGVIVYADDAPSPVKTQGK